jgi:hypothetical protein
MGAVVLHVEVLKLWPECGSVLVECSQLGKPEPLLEKVQLVQVNF